MDFRPVLALPALLLSNLLATPVTAQVWTGSAIDRRAHVQHAIHQRTTLAAWSDWTDTPCKVHCQEGITCNTTCGPGFEWRSRTCSTGVNADCESPGESAIMAVSCDISCVVEWTAWETHSACSHTCGHGFAQRTRNCTNGNVQDCSREHANEWWELTMCNYGPCAHWLEWATWSACTVTCGTGAQGRLRTCSTGNTGDCAGSHYQLVSCNAHCLDKVCGQLTSPVHGNVVVSDVTPGSTATFSCDVGYSLGGTAVLNCTADGYWSGTSPSCSIMCSPLVNPTNGNVMVTNYVFGGTARFTCHKGYDVNGPALLHCLDEGQWSSTPPECVIECPDIDAPRHGIVSPYTKTKGSFVHTYCISGYTLKGRAIRVCQDNGQWSGTDPTCQLSD